MARKIQTWLDQTVPLFISFSLVKLRNTVVCVNSHFKLSKMNIQQQILEILTDPSRILRAIPVLTAQQKDVLDRVWSWDDEITGLPNFDDPNPNIMWMRRLPASMVLFPTSAISVPNFMERMQSNVQRFTIYCVGNEKQSLLNAILQADIKKIRVRDLFDQGLEVEKTIADLMDYDNPPMLPLTYPLQSLRSKVPGTQTSKLNGDLLAEINLNAMRGFTGAGTHQCRHSKCTVSGSCMTQTREVRWGPDPTQIFTPLRRFKCNANNVTYLLFCDACLQMGLWSTYVGESERSVDTNRTNLHTRISGHISKIVHDRLKQKFPHDSKTLLAIASGMHELGEPDPDQLLRDPFTHFNVVHTPEDRRYVILDGNYKTVGERQLHESILKHHFGNFIYDPTTRSGALNHPI